MGCLGGILFSFRCTIYRWWRPADFAIERCLLAYTPRDELLGIDLTRGTYPILLYLFNFSGIDTVFLLTDARFISFLSISYVFFIRKKVRTGLLCTVWKSLCTFFISYIIFLLFIRKITLKFVLSCFSFLVLIKLLIYLNFIYYLVIFLLLYLYILFN